MPGLIASTQQAVYGDLLNQPLKRDEHWLSRLSFDNTFSTTEGVKNHVALFQNPGSRHLDVLISFDNATFRTPDGAEVSLGSLDQQVRAWWSGMREGSVESGTAGIRLFAPRKSIWQRLLTAWKR